MSEPCCGVVWSDEGDGIGDGLIEFLCGPGADGTEMLFDLCPGLFDGIEIGGIGRQIEHLRFSGLDQLAHLFELVRTEIVQHHHVAGFECRAQDLSDIGEEDIAVGGFLDGHGPLDSAEAHRR